MKVTFERENFGTESEADRTTKISRGLSPNEQLPQTPSLLTDATVAGNTNGMLSEFGRWRDVERLFGIKRGLLHLICAEGKVKSVLIRRRGNIHGTRYYYLPSVRAYLHGLMEEQVGQEKNKNLSGSAGLGSDCGQNQLDVDSSRLVNK
jgi:hypothetical protein